jgi:hypothetical protein
LVVGIDTTDAGSAGLEIRRLGGRFGLGTSADLRRRRLLLEED